jgi:hypothetical protein
MRVEADDGERMVVEVWGVYPGCDEPRAGVDVALGAA